MKLIQNARSYEEVMEALAEQYPNMDDAKFQKTLAKAFFISETFGRING